MVIYVRILENTKSVETRDMQSQLLDSMDLERERGITIKLNAVRLKYDAKDETYTFHLIDTQDMSILLMRCLDHLQHVKVLY